MGGELTEENLKKMFESAGEFKPDTFMLSAKALKELNKLGLVKYDPIKCSRELLEEAYSTTPSKAKKKGEQG